MNADADLTDLAGQRRYRALEDEYDELLYAFSHDFAAPTRQTKQFARLLIKKIDAQLSEETARCVELMDQAITRSENMLDSLLALSRATARNDDPRPLDCVPLVREILDSYGERTKEASLSYHGPDAAMLTGDAGQLRALFGALVDNAVKYRRDGVPLEVRVSAAPLGAGWRFEVHDNGKGFSHERLDKVFALFRNIDSAERNTRVALGLAMSRTLVRRHEGEIRCERSVPGDTRIVFSLGTPLPPPVD